MDELTELERLFDNFRMVGQDGITVHGSLYTGYAVQTPLSGAGAGGVPGFPGGVIPPTGACCNGTDCSIHTQSDCQNSGGTYQGDGTDCDPNPCTGTTTGACCFDNGNCFIETSSDCAVAGGHYQGDGTACGDIDCSHGGPGTSGACCVGSDCFVESPVGCFNLGGRYIGDNTTCPNPCCCGFTGFTSEHRYAVKTVTVVRTDHIPSNPFGCTLGCNTTWNFTSTYTTTINEDGSCGAVTHVCSGSASVTDCGGTTSHCNWVDLGSDCGSDFGCTVSSMECDESCLDFVFCAGGTVTIESDTTEVCHCRFDAPPPNEGVFAELTVTTTLSSQIC